MTDRRPGSVTLTPAMARFVYGVVFEGREHLHEQGPQRALLDRFHKAGHGQPRQELEGQVPIAGLLDETRVVEEYSSHRITPESEQAAALALATDNAAVAAASRGRIVSAAGGVTGGLPHHEPMADPVDYESEGQMEQTAAERARRGHGAAAGSF